MGMPGHSAWTMPDHLAGGVGCEDAARVLDHDGVDIRPGVVDRPGLLRPVGRVVRRAARVHQRGDDLGPLLLADAREEVEALGVGLVVADPETLDAVGHRTSDPQGDDVLGGVDVEAGELGGHVRPAQVGARHGFRQEADALPGVLAVVARLDDEPVAPDGGDGLDSPPRPWWPRWARSSRCSSGIPRGSAAHRGWSGRPR